MKPVEPSFIDRLVQRLLSRRSSQASPVMEARLAALHHERGTRTPLELRRAQNRRRNHAARIARRGNRH